MNLKYHKTLTSAKWSNFPFFKQILMIANELNRANKWIEKGDFLEVKFCYERAFELLYLTIEVLEDKRKLKELLRFKEVLAMLYNQKRPKSEDNLKLLNVLILLDKESFLLLNR